jgi:hypothetical protein
MSRERLELYLHKEVVVYSEMHCMVRGNFMYLTACWIRCNVRDTSYPDAEVLFIIIKWLPSNCCIQNLPLYKPDTPSVYRCNRQVWELQATLEVTVDFTIKFRQVRFHIYLHIHISSNYIHKYDTQLPLLKLANVSAFHPANSVQENPLLEANIPLVVKKFTALNGTQWSITLNIALCWYIKPCRLVNRHHYFGEVRFFEAAVSRRNVVTYLQDYKSSYNRNT